MNKNIEKESTENRIYETHKCFVCGNEIKVDITNLKKGVRYGYHCNKCGTLADCINI